MQGALQQAVAENPELAQQEPALLKLANKVTYISIPIYTFLSSLLAVQRLHQSSLLTCVQVRLYTGQGC